jgi:acyl carrier protein
MENNKQNVELFLIRMFDEKFGIGSVEIDVESKKMHDDYGLDSLDFVEVCMDVEKEFNIAIPDTMAEDWNQMTIRQIAEQVASIG